MKPFGKSIKDMTDKELDTHIKGQKFWLFLIVGAVIALILVTGIKTLITNTFTGGVAFTLNLAFIGVICQLLSTKWAQNEKRFRSLEK